VQEIIINDSVYVAIAANINKTAWRAPKSQSGNGFSKAFLEYIRLLYTPEEAAVAQHLKIVKDIFSTTIEPTSFMTATQLAKVSGISRTEIDKALRQMSDKNVDESYGHVRLLTCPMTLYTVVPKFLNQNH